ncbi:MAG TPA: transporter substrate-binding domain-containing protein [Dongiaceae bacterium]|nr:transporter substrate-binding domain-containing protein [Dongiaceae bacterium]
MLNKAITSLLASAVMLALAFAPAKADSGEDSVQKIQSAGVLKVGMADSGVMQSKDPASGQWRGFNVDMANKVAKVLGVKLEIVDASWSTLIPGLQAGQFDIAFVDMFPTAARAATVNFTDPYATHGWQIIVAKDSKYQKASDLDDPSVTVAALTGSIEEAIRPELFPKAQTKQLVTENLSSMVQEVLAGRVQATMLEPYNIKSMEKRNPGMSAKLRFLNDEEHLMRPTGIAYAVRPGDDHLLRFLNTFIAEEKTTGESQRLYDQWLSQMTQ